MFIYDEMECKIILDNFQIILCILAVVIGLVLIILFFLSNKIENAIDRSFYEDIILFFFMMHMLLFSAFVKFLCWQIFWNGY